MDTPCFFGRDLSKFQAFARAWYADKLSGVIDKVYNITTFYRCMNSSRLIVPKSLPYSVVYFSDFLPKGNGPHMEIFFGIVQDMEAQLGVRAKELCIAEAWEKSPPAEAGGTRLEDFIGPDVSMFSCTRFVLTNKSRLPLVRTSIRFGSV